MRRSISAVVAATLGVALLPGSFASAQEGTGRITGQVTAADGGAGIGGVCVDALPADEDSEQATARTAADGRYTLTVAEGTYFLAFNACEEPADGWVGTIRGFEGEGDPFVDVAAGGTTSGVDVALATAGEITGRVTREGSGEALADVCVQSQTDGAILPAVARTASDGTYRITTAAPGDAQVIFIDCDAPRLSTPEVYPDTPIWPISESNTGDPVTVTADGTTTGIDASLLLGGSIQGAVTLVHTGGPALFAIVGAWATDDTDELPTAFAFAGMPALGVVAGVRSEPADPGRFELPGVPADDYLLELQPGAFGFGGAESWQQRWYEGADDRASATAITVATGQTVDGIALELVPTSSIDPLCAGSQADYPDVRAENVHATAIGCMSDAGVVRGGTDGRYRPAQAVRRDQMASFLARLLQNSLGTSPSGDVPDAFSDDDGNVHEPSIDYLASLGIVEGDGSGRYHPDGLVGRGQMATYLARAYEVATGATLRTPATSFRDVEGTAHATSIRKVAVAAIAAGTSASTYEPNEPVARDQMATFMARLQTRLFLDAGMFLMTTSSGEVSGSAAMRTAAAAS